MHAGLWPMAIKSFMKNGGQQKCWCCTVGVTGKSGFDLKLVSAIFYQTFHQMVTLKKIWKIFFISSKNLRSFPRNSNFCNFFPSFLQLPDSKGQMEVE